MQKSDCSIQAKEQLILHAPLYWFSFTFKRHCRSVAYAKIKENGFNPKFNEFLDEAIGGWLEKGDMQLLVDGTLQ